MPSAPDFLPADLQSTALCHLAPRGKKKSGRRWLLPSDYQSAVFVIWAVTSLRVESSLKEKKKKRVQMKCYCYEK